MAINVEIRELTENRVKLLVKGTHHVFMNMLRRTMIADVPKMAIHNVDFHHGSLGSAIEDDREIEFESSSPLFDEMIAHRLGLIPISTDLSIFNRRNECPCGGEGCPSCTIMYAINKRGPCVVYSGDLEPVNHEAYRIRNDLIPIVKLDEGQALLVYATAELGTGKEHAKFQAVQAAGYQYYPKITVKEKISEDSEASVKVCPRGVLEWDGKQKRIKVKDLEACNLCMACTEVCEDDSIRVEYDPTQFLMSFETDASFPPEVVLDYALDLLNKKLNGLIESISALE